MAFSSPRNKMRRQQSPARESSAAASPAVRSQSGTSTPPEDRPSANGSFGAARAPLSLACPQLGGEHKLSFRGLSLHAPRAASAEPASSRVEGKRIEQAKDGSEKELPGCGLAATSAVVAELRQFLREELLGREMRALLKEELALAAGLAGGLVPGPGRDANGPPGSHAGRAIDPLGAELAPGLERRGVGRDPDVEALTYDMPPDVQIVSEASAGIKSDALSEMRRAIVEDHQENMMHLDAKVLIAHEYPERLRPVIQGIVHVVDHVGNQEAPHPNPYLQAFLNSWAWNMFVNVVIVVNCAWEISNVNRRLDLVFASAESTSSLQWEEVVFTAFYFIEITLRLTCYRWYFLVDSNWKGNTLDMILTFGNVWVLCSSFLMEQWGKGSSPGWLRIFRLIRLLKVARVLRLSASFKTLSVLLTSITDTLMATVWCFLLLTLFYLVGALVICSILSTSLQDEHTLGQDDIDELEVDFGSVGLAMLSFVKATTGGRDWGELYDHLTSVDHWNSALFLAFIMFIQIAMMNIILGVFVDHAMQSMKSDEVQQAHQLVLDARHTRQRLHALCTAVDLDGSGRLTKAEWKRIAREPPMGEMLFMMGFEQHELDNFFAMLSSGSDGEESVSIDHFVTGCMRLRGAASSFQTNQVLYELLAMKNTLSGWEGKIEKLAAPREQSGQK